MKNALTYGFGISIASSLLTLVIYFLGYHNDLEKMIRARPRFWAHSTG